MTIRKCVLLLALCIHAPLLANNSPSLVDLHAGLIAQDAGKLSNSASGDTALLAATYLDIGLSAHFDLGSDWNLSPFLAFTPFGNKSADTDEKSRLMPIAVRLQKTFDSAFFHLGPGLLIYSISGSGGTATLNNGTGSSVFGLPSESRSSTLVMIDAGGGIDLWKLKLGLDLLMTGLFSSRRAINPMLNLGFGLL